MELVILFFVVFPLVFLLLFMGFLRLLLVGFRNTEPQGTESGEGASALGPRGLPLPTFFSKLSDGDARSAQAHPQEAQFLHFQHHIDREQAMVAEFLARPTVEGLYRVPDGGWPRV